MHLIVKCFEIKLPDAFYFLHYFSIFNIPISKIFIISNNLQCILDIFLIFLLNISQIIILQNKFKLVYLFFELIFIKNDLVSHIFKSIIKVDIWRSFHCAPHLKLYQTFFVFLVLFIFWYIYDFLLFIRELLFFL